MELALEGKKIIADFHRRHPVRLTKSVAPTLFAELSLQSLELSAEAPLTRSGFRTANRECERLCPNQGVCLLLSLAGLRGRGGSLAEGSALLTRQGLHLGRLLFWV